MTLPSVSSTSTEQAAARTSSPVTQGRGVRRVSSAAALSSIGDKSLFRRDLTSSVGLDLEEQATRKRFQMYMKRSKNDPSAFYRLGLRFELNYGLPNIYDELNVHERLSCAIAHYKTGIEGIERRYSYECCRQLGMLLVYYDERMDAVVESLRSSGSRVRKKPIDEEKRMLEALGLFQKAVEHRNCTAVDRVNMSHAIDLKILPVLRQIRFSGGEHEISPVNKAWCQMFNMYFNAVKFSRSRFEAKAEAAFHVARLLSVGCELKYLPLEFRCLPQDTRVKKALHYMRIAKSCKRSLSEVIPEKYKLLQFTLSGMQLSSSSRLRHSGGKRSLVRSLSDGSSGTGQ